MDFMATAWDVIVWTYGFMVAPEYRSWKFAIVAGVVVALFTKGFRMALLKSLLYVLVPTVGIVFILERTS